MQELGIAAVRRARTSDRDAHPFLFGWTGVRLKFLI